MNKTPYSNGFDVIIEDIINKNSIRPKKDKCFIKIMDKIFKGVCNLETLEFVFMAFQNIILQEDNLTIRNLKIDCLKRQRRCKTFKL